jgi:hypothetical protein
VPAPALRAKENNLSAAKSPSAANGTESDFFRRLSATLPAKDPHWQCGVRCTEMRDSSDLLNSGNSRALWERLMQDGFLLLRQVLPKEATAAVRQQALDKLDSIGAARPASAAERAGPGADALKDGWIAMRKSYERQSGAVKSNSRDQLISQGWLVDLADGVVQPDEAVAPLRDWPDVRSAAEVKGLPIHAKLQETYRMIFRLSGLSWRALPAEEHSSWLRAKAHGEGTRPHSDYGYFRRYRSILSRYYCARPLTAQQAEEQRCHDVQGLDPFQCQSRCFWYCRLDPAANPPRHRCSLCMVGYHTECLAEAGVAPPTDGEKEALSKGHGEWHCSVCSEANMDMWTCWIPLGKIPADPAHSRLMVLPGSHLMQGYAAQQSGTKTHRSAHQSADTESQEEVVLPRSWSGDARAGAVWHAPSQLEAGDIILFNAKLIHAANPNTSGQFRLSLDTRVIATFLWIKETAAAALG